MKLSPLSPTPHRPRHWSQRVAASYWRLLGLTQQETAGVIRRSKRTIQRWEADPTWHTAKEEAGEQWLADLTAQARRTVFDAVKGGNADIGLKILERRIPELAPPKAQIELSIPWDALSDEQLRRLAAGEHPAKVLGAWHANGSTPQG